MTKHLRIITALLALIFCVSAVSSFSVTVFAESQVSEEPANPDPVITPEPVNPEPVNPDPVTPEPDPVTPEPDPVTPEPEPVSPEPYNDDSGYNSNSNNNNNSNNNYNNYGSGDSDNGSSADNGSESSAVYYDSDGNEHDSQSDVYVGGGQTYVPPVSTAPSAPLIKTQNNIDVNELSKNDWNDIKASLAKANKNGGMSDGDDFSFIQKNTAKGDNGHLVLVLGITMLVLSVAGFTYLIVSAVRRRRQMAAPLAAKAAAHSSASGHYRDDSDYNDGFKASSKKADKFDTAKIPNASKAKQKGGKRYK